MTGGAGRRVRMGPGLGVVASTLADGLALSAAPAFAAMALLSAVAGHGQGPMLCAPADETALGGMVTMNLLMSLFHLPPWLRRIGPAGSPAPQDASRDPALHGGA